MMEITKLHSYPIKGQLSHYKEINWIIYRASQGCLLEQIKFLVMEHKPE